MFGDRSQIGPKAIGSSRGDALRADEVSWDFHCGPATESNGDGE